MTIYIFRYNVLSLQFAIEKDITDGRQPRYPMNIKRNGLCMYVCHNVFINLHSKCVLIWQI